ncbi:UDP-sugar pyrophosphorylase [Perilla frutescens var. hirtella]|nr:UDP-sugar pyrophosphorylase [Perilla frutescens var. hirtella]
MWVSALFFSHSCLVRTSRNLCEIERDSGRLSSSDEASVEAEVVQMKSVDTISGNFSSSGSLFWRFETNGRKIVVGFVTGESGQKRKLDEMYDLSRTEVKSMKRSTIQPVNHSFSIQEPDLFSNPETRMDSTNSIRKGETLTFGEDNFIQYENVGIREAKKAAFVLVAGVLGEHLGYNGIKVALPLESVTGTCFLQHYIESILALQDASCKLAEARKLVIGWCSQLATT